ncbi:SDR family NAD(P)-dependent oxidoreductase [Henriciella mobilis]|uniref:SDR family NAD(P)-dependent oxidoreductase n=1 Tax=Henriciella mobilis TaxID=2305467 RepID=UPI00131404B2|nr:SDR family oxidoreductase [Henriciella mobilis]
MTYDFSGKNAVVTGASRGIGEAIARTLAEGGARVALVARNTEALEKLAKQLPNDPVVLHADLSSPEGWKPLAEAILEQLGPVDILVNNAGVAVQEPAGKVTEEGLDTTLTVNVRNLILLTDALSDSLKSRKGNIVSISSVSAFSGSIGQIAYSASKGAVNSMTRNLSLDLGRSGVRVNAVAPGVIDDGMWKTAFDAGLDREKTMERIGKVVALEGRWGSAQNVADAVAFLASDKADYITGQVLRVDGGIMA